MRHVLKAGTTTRQEGAAQPLTVTDTNDIQSVRV